MSPCLPLSQDSQVTSTRKTPLGSLLEVHRTCYGLPFPRVDKGSDKVVRQQNFSQLKGEDVNKPV